MMKLFFAILLMKAAVASHPEFFGSAPTTSSLGNQANTNVADPANLYYIPAFSAWSDSIAVNGNLAGTTHDLEPISNIVTENSTNGQSGTDVVRGDANTTYDDSFNNSLHFLLPLRGKDSGAVGISFFAPVGKFAETNSGSATLPEYALYKARYRRTQLHLNYAYPISERFAFSLGAHVGFQASARVNTNVSLSNNYGSSGNAKTKINPSLGAILSFAYRSAETNSTYFTFQQEMKSNLEAIATGEISDPPLTLINVGLDSMIYYDPHILRLGHIQRFDSFSLNISGEYQMWSNYEAPVIKVTNLGGTVKASDQYERLNLKNIFVPKLGLSLFATEDLTFNFGLSYRQSPFDSDFSGSGNTIDTNSLIAATGMSSRHTFWNKSFLFSASIQYHQLEEKTVTKTAGQENGSSGLKIGAPGYKIGGSVMTLMTGVTVTF